MKRFVLAALAALGLGSGAEAQTTLTFAAYSGIFQEKYTEAVIRPFEAANPGITVRYFPMFNSAQQIGSLYAQRNEPTVDVVLMDAVVSKSGTDQNLFEPLTPELVPNIAQLSPRARLAGLAGVAATFDTAVIIYNPRLVQPAPTSWNILADPRYSGQIAISAPPGLLGVSLTILLDRMAGGTDPLRGVNRGIERMVQIAPHVKSFESRDWYPLVASGEVVMGLGWSARTELYADQTNGAVLGAVPEEGTVMQVNTVNLVNRAPNRAAALTFINYMLSAEAQAAVARTMYYLPTNAQVQLTPEQRRRARADLGDRIMDVDWVGFAPVNARLTQEWRRRVMPAASR